MLIFAADDEKLMLGALARCIKEAEPGCDVRQFSRSGELLLAVKGGLLPDAAFLDIELPGLGGMELAREIKAVSPRTNIIFVTGHPQYALEAHSLHASGYLLKPVTAEAVRAELSDLRHPPETGENGEKRIFVQCFGNFEVFVNGKPVQFLRSKSKELLAYLVDKQGTGASMAELANILWEDGVYDRARQKQMQVYVNDLRKSLRAANAECMLIKSKNSLMADKNRFECDFYNCLAGDPAALSAYTGQYMYTYSWAEPTSAYISQTREQSLSIAGPHSSQTRE